MFVKRFFVLPMVVAIVMGLFLLPGCDGGMTYIQAGFATGPKSSPPPPPPPANRGLAVAAQNHIRNAHKFLAKGMPDKALDELRKAEEKDPRSFWVHYYRGGALYLQGNYPGANNSWELAFGIASDGGFRSRIRVCQSFAFFSLGNEGRADASLQLALNLDPQNTRARLFLEEGKTAGGSVREGKGKKEPKGKAKGRKLGQKSEFNSYFLIRPNF